MMIRQMNTELKANYRNQKTNRINVKEKLKSREENVHENKRGTIKR